MLKPALMIAAFGALSLTASAHPHKPLDETEDTASTQELADVLADKFADHSADLGKSMAKMKRKLDNTDGDLESELDAVADALEEAFSEDGVLREMANMFGDFASDLDIESEDGVTVFKFDDKTLGRVKREKSRDSEDTLSLSGLGKNMTIERETYIEDGKTRTRIVIEMDGEAEVSLDEE